MCLQKESGVGTPWLLRGAYTGGGHGSNGREEDLMGDDHGGGGGEKGRHGYDWVAKHATRGGEEDVPIGEKRKENKERK